MKFRLKPEGYYVLVIIILIGLCGQFYYSYKYLPAREVQVFYNQDTRANEKIIEQIQQANSFVYFAVYTFTRKDIGDALLSAKYRGLKVVGITDRDQLEKIEVQNTIINELKKAGIPIYTQNHSGIMHLKVLVTDKAYVSGSYNWTGAATTLNDEVIEVGHDETIRKQYQHVLEEIFEKYK